MPLRRRPDPPAVGALKGDPTVSRYLAAALSATALVLGLAACGGSSSGSTTQSSAASASSSSSSPASTSSSSSTTAASAPAPGGGGSLTQAADPSGALKFTKHSLTAKAGAVTIKFSNASSVPHNLTIQQGTGGAVVGATPTFSGGSKTLTVKLKPGTYTFFCSVDGHRAAGMQGTLTVH
jgi:plastocyanin